MNLGLEFREDEENEAPVRGFLHGTLGTESDCLILAHGAGANCNAPVLVTLAAAFAENGLPVLRCDLPFRQARPQGPPPRGSAGRDQRGLAAAVAAIRRRTSGRISLGGHSYGGRQASMLAADQPALASALLLLSYPLHPPLKPAELRTAHFSHLKVPALFVHGARDGFGSLEEMAEALKLIPAPTEFLPISGAGHELLAKRNPAAAPSIVEAFRRFADSHR